MNWTTDQIQRDIKARLQACPALAGVVVLAEHDPDADAAQLAAQAELWETTLATKGLVLTVMQPHYKKQDAARHVSLAMRAICPVVAFENPEVNRKAGGAWLTIASALDAAQLALLPQYDFEEEPLTPPDRYEELHTRSLLPSIEIEREDAS